MNIVEPQLHRIAAGILMKESRHFIPDDRLNSQFLIQFASQRIARLFAIFNFSAGEFPFQRHHLVARALANQNFPVFPDEGCDNALDAQRPPRMPAVIERR